MLEKLIEILAALIASIDRNTAALAKAPAAAPAEEKKKTKEKVEKPAEPAPEAPAVPTVEEVRTAATELLDLDVDNNQKQTCTPIKALRDAHGVKKISDVAPEKRSEVIAALKAAIVAFKNKPKQAEEV